MFDRASAGLRRRTCVGDLSASKTSLSRLALAAAAASSCPAPLSTASLSLASPLATSPPTSTKAGGAATGVRPSEMAMSASTSRLSCGLMSSQRKTSWPRGRGAVQTPRSTFHVGDRECNAPRGV